MPAKSPLDRAIRSIADGRAVDWSALDIEARTEEEREELRCLRIVHEIGDLHRSPDNPFGSGDTASIGLPMPADEGSQEPQPHSEDVDTGDGIGSLDRSWDPALEQEVVGKILHRLQNLHRDGQLSLASITASVAEAEKEGFPSESLLVDSGVPGVASTGSRDLDTSPLPAEPDEGPRLFAQLPQFKYLGSIGRGGMGTVYRVLDRSLNRTMALKVIQPRLSGSPLAMARFIREAQVTAQLDHPGIVPVHEIARLPDGRCYYTMKEVRGRTLTDAIRECHRVDQPSSEPTGDGWTLRRVVDIFFRACEAVAYAHAHDVLHRDLKPANILFRGYGEVHVVDWGLAKWLNAQEPPLVDIDAEVNSADLRADVLTQVGQVSGTLSYMSPEQASGKQSEIGKPSDVFSLGAILYEVLTGRLAFKRSKVEDILAEDHAGAPAEFLEGDAAPEELRSICLKAISWDPKRRYPDAGALASDIAAWLEGSRRQTRVLAWLRGAESLFTQVQELHAEAQSLERQAELGLEPLPRGAPVEVKRSWWALQDQADQRQREAAARAAEFTQTVRLALNYAPESPEALALLTRHFVAEHREAELAGDAARASRLETQIRGIDTGAYGSYLKGDGTLTLVTDPPGATVEVYRYRARDRRLQPEFVETIGSTPVRDRRLPMGSYLLVVAAEGRATVRIPVLLGRQQRWDNAPPDDSKSFPIYLPGEAELAPDERYVPAGWFWSGGDSTTYGRRSMLPRRRLWIDGFAIRSHHVSIGEYVDYLNTLLLQGLEEQAVAVAPRTAGYGAQMGAQMFERDADGQFFIPENNVYGIPMEAHWPILFVDWHGASAYCRWMASQTGLPYRLPWELEWEKAARGVDGRRYPWGDYLDPTFARMMETHLGVATMAPAGTYPVDESPYGVRDMAGNQRDWCLDIVSEEGPPISPAGKVLGPRIEHPYYDIRVTRGGNFIDSPIWCWTNYRGSFIPHVRDYTMSFRTARSLGAASV